MIRVLLEADQVQVPTWVVDLDSFRRWSDDDAFPERGLVSFLQGDVWIDMSKEQLFSHNQVKMAIAFVLMGLIRAGWQGRYFGDGVFLSHIEADISNQPDGVLVSAASLEEARVRVVEGRAEGHVELEGSPDLVLEVVSRSSVEKDTVVLRRAYAEAGVREYWLIDARGESVGFEVLRLAQRGYTASRQQAGWIWSEVLGRWFRLTHRTGADGFPEYTLEQQTDNTA